MVLKKIVGVVIKRIVHVSVVLKRNLTMLSEQSKIHNSLMCRSLSLQ